MKLQLLEAEVEILSGLSINDVQNYVEAEIGSFHEKRIKSLSELKLKDILNKKNPYLFKVKNALSANDLVKAFLDAHLSSQEETMFGNFLEGLAIFICSKVYGGRKSVATGIDLEFDKDNTRYFVSIKSGPNWGNNSQIKKMVENFNSANKIYRQGDSKRNCVNVNGCCYGRLNKADKGTYFKYCGEKFWEFISGDSTLYLGIIEPLGHQAKERNEKFEVEFNAMLNMFVKEFIDDFCTTAGHIDWEILVKFNSGHDKFSKVKRG